MNNDIAISVKNLSKRYFLQHPVQDEHGHKTNELWALKDVSFDIKKGESVGIIGPNGSGKSTLLKVLAGVTKPTSGSVEINGRVASILDIGAGFHPELSGRENVFLNGQLLGFREREINAKFDEIVAFSGIEKFIDEPVKNYSNGMYLRLAFSILVNLDFDVYLLDEVMNVGDVKFIIKSKDKIKQLAQNKKTVIYVSHNMKELENKDVYMRLEYGVLKGKTNLEKILDEFVYESIESMKDIHVHTHNVEITDFSSYPSSDKVKIHSVKFYQENIEKTGAFCTNNPFVLEIDYEKLKHQNTIDVVVNIFDYNGISILSTAPFVKGDFSDEISPHRVNAKCIIPEYIFNTQIYFIKILFLEGLLKGMDTIKDVQIDRLHFEKKVTSIVLSLDNIFAFKTLFFSKNKSLDFSTLNLKGNLLAGFEWHSSIYME